MRRELHGRKATVTSLIVIATGTLLAPAAGVHANAVDDLLPGHWLEIPDTRIEDLDPEDDPALNPNYPFGAPWRGFEGQQGIVNDWSSAVVDTTRNTFSIWGGGHSGYAGNEVYVFDIETLTWDRVTDPSVDVSVNGTWYYNDGEPRARETYNYLEYVPAVDRMICFGGGNLYPGSGNHTTTELMAFDFDTRTWSNSFGMHSGVPWRAYNTMVVVDGLTGDVFMKQPGFNALHHWDPVANVWTKLVGTGATATEYNNAVIDERNRYFLWTGRPNSDMTVWDMNTLDNPVIQPTRGSREIEAEDYPGYAWDPVSERIIGWIGGTHVYTLDTDNWLWTIIDDDPANTVAPTEPNFNGTMGRFRYVPSKDAFIVYNRVEDNVFFYKLPRDKIGDADLDGVADASDNCLYVANPSQCDTNGDGYGNHCDADIDNNGTVNSFDLEALRSVFGSVGANDADLDCNGVVNSFDLLRLRDQFGEGPGLSGTTPP